MLIRNINEIIDATLKTHRNNETVCRMIKHLQNYIQVDKEGLKLKFLRSYPADPIQVDLYISRTHGEYPFLEARFIDYIQTYGYIELWKKSFSSPQETNTTPIWNGKLNNFFSSRTKLILSGVQLTVMKILDKFYCDLFYDILYKKFSSLSHYDGYRDRTEAWELLCLSGYPEALTYACKTLGITQHTTNLFGESPIHLVTLSGYRKQLRQALVLMNPDILKPIVECKVPVNTVKGLTALHIAAFHNLRDITLDLMIYAPRGLQITDEKGRTPLNCAVTAEADDVIQLFSQFDARKPNKVTIFIPLGVANEMNHLLTPTEIEKHGELSVLPQEIAAPDTLDFAMIAKRISCASAQKNIEVAETLDELKSIIDLNFSCREYSSVYAIQIEVEMAKLHRDAHWALKRDTIIRSEDILHVSIHTEYNPHLTKLIESINATATNAHVVEKHINYLKAQKSIKKFLRDESFWREHVSAFRLRLGLSLFPLGIQSMQTLCNQVHTITLNQLCAIAQEYCPPDYTGITGLATSFFSADATEKSFYRAIINAKTIYDVAQWIDAHYSAPTMKLNQTAKPY